MKDLDSDTPIRFETLDITKLR